MTTGLLLVVIIIVAAVLWLVPMPETLRKVLIAVVVVSFVVWLCYLLGLVGGGGAVVRD